MPVFIIPLFKSFLTQEESLQITHLAEMLVPQQDKIGGQILVKIVNSFLLSFSFSFVVICHSDAGGNFQVARQSPVFIIPLFVILTQEEFYSYSFIKDVLQAQQD
jgi:hypothetical protein